MIATVRVMGAGGDGEESRVGEVVSCGEDIVQKLKIAKALGEKNVGNKERQALGESKSE